MPSSAASEIDRVIEKPKRWPRTFVNALPRPVSCGVLLLLNLGTPNRAELIETRRVPDPWSAAVNVVVSVPNYKHPKGSWCIVADSYTHAGRTVDTRVRVSVGRVEHNPGVTASRNRLRATSDRFTSAAASAMSTGV